jgi:hypothetical protein
VGYGRMGVVLRDLYELCMICHFASHGSSNILKRPSYLTLSSSPLSAALSRTREPKHQVVAEIDRLMTGIEVYAPNAVCVSSMVFAWLDRSEVAGSSR